MNYIEFLHNRDKYLGENHDNFLMHYGVLGQKWGQRHWQNPDGTYTTEGKIRYFGSKKAQAEVNEEKVGSIYSTGQKIKELLTSNKEINENGQEYDRRYQYSDGSLTTRGYELSEKQRLKKINTDMLENYKNKESERREAERIEKEKKDAELQNRIKTLDDEVITNKYPKSSNKLTDEEFETIANDLDKWKEDFYNGKTDRHLNTLVADLGINALNKARGYNNAEVGNNNDREWFMYEDQTLGNPEIAYLYVKGYSKDYIKGMLNHKIEIDSDEEYNKLYDKHPTTMFTQNEYHDGNQYIDALFELKEGFNDKIGGLFKKTDEEKEFKEAERLAQKLNFDNGTKVIKELKNTEYGKKHIKPLYDEYEENMNKLSDKANKIIKDNPADEIEAGIANAIDTSGGNANIGYIINCIRKQHYANSADSFINVDSLPLLKSEEDLWTEALKYKKDFGDKIEKEFKNLYPKAKTNLSYFIALTDYENDKLDKIHDMSDEDYRRYQLYHQINYGLVPEINKKSIRKDIIEPAEKLYPKVEKIINNTKVGDPSYDWSDIGKALVELGLDKKNADELTNADWKKVYEICSQ